MVRIVALLLMILSASHAADAGRTPPTAFPVGSSLPLSTLSGFLGLSPLAMTQKTLDPVSRDTAIRYPSFTDYYQTSSKSREGKMFEAEFANRYNSAKSGKVCIPTSVLGESTDPADVIIVDSTSGKIEGHIQCKRTLTLSDIDDPRYSGMRFATTAESTDNLLREVKAAAVSAERCGVPLGDKLTRISMKIYGDAVVTAFPNGTPMPSIDTITKESRKMALQEFKLTAPEVPIERPLPSLKTPSTVVVSDSDGTEQFDGKTRGKISQMESEVAEKAVIVVYVVILGKYAKDVVHMENDTSISEEEKAVLRIEAKLRLFDSVPFSAEFRTAMIDHPEYWDTTIKDPLSAAKSLANEVYQESMAEVDNQKQLMQEHAVRAAAALRTAQRFYSENAAQAAYQYKDMYDKSMFAHAVTYWSQGDSE